MDRTTEYSHRRVLVLSPVRMAHAGLLTCSGTNERGARERSSTWLGVTGERAGPSSRRGQSGGVGAARAARVRRCAPGATEAVPWRLRLGLQVHCVLYCDLLRDPPGECGLFLTHINSSFSPQ